MTRIMIAVAYVSSDPGAYVTYEGLIGIRHCDIEKLICRKAEELIFLYKAGPCGYHLYHIGFYEGLGLRLPRAQLD